MNTNTSMVHVTSEVLVAQSWYLDNLQVMVQYDVDHSVQLLLWIYTKYWILSKLQNVIEQYCSFKQWKGLQDVLAQEPLSTAYSFVNCLLESTNPASYHCKMQTDKACTFCQIRTYSVIIYYVFCALHTVVCGVLDRIAIRHMRWWTGQPQ